MSLFIKFCGSFSNASRSFCSPSKILALPINTLFSKPPSTPASFKIELFSGDRLPPKTLNPPVFLYGFLTEKTTSPSGREGERRSICSFKVSPVHVKVLPFNKPDSNKSLTKTCTPPFSSISTIEYFPNGLALTKTGTTFSDK